MANHVTHKLNLYSLLECINQTWILNPELMVMVVIVKIRDIVINLNN